MPTSDQTSAAIDLPIAAYARDYRAARDAHIAAKESVKPAAQAEKEARFVLHTALKELGTAIVVDGRLYEIAGNGTLVERPVQVIDTRTV